MGPPLKSVVGHVLLGSGLHKAVMKDTAVITAFHRVENQRELDPITVRKKDFEEFCRYARAHFDVVSLSTLLARLAADEAVSNCMVITFDDGYEDNYSTAARVLERYGLPAIFFRFDGLHRHGLPTGVGQSA